jgi:hypothetical protein
MELYQSQRLRGEGIEREVAVRVTLRRDGLRRTALLCRYALLAGVGELNLPKLGIDVPLYDPMVHYQQVRDAWTGVRTPAGR